jgi:inorganic triphosphatase YgiF
MSALEQEVKYRLTLLPLPGHRILPLLLTALQARLLDRRTLHLRDIYWDTPQQAFRKAGCALRIRYRQGAPFWTAKCRLVSQDPSLQIRREWEHPADRRDLERFLHDPQWAHLPEPARRMLPHVKAPLVPLVDARSLRVAWQLQTAHRRLVAHREEVWYAHRREVYLEVEGPPTLLHTLVRALSVHAGMLPTLETKLSRGLTISRRLSTIPRKNGDPR